MNDVASAIAAVRERIAAAAARAGRRPQEVTLLAVTKTVPVERVREAVGAGVHDLGENRVQEAEAKIVQLQEPVRWHFLGRLQSNKARKAARLFACVHSVDRPELLERLAAAAAAQGRCLPVYVQADYVRSGLNARQVDERVRALCELAAASPTLRLCGLMVLPPYDPDPEAARGWFRRLRRLRDRIGGDLGRTDLGLSMGMSADFEIAVQEGATIVRVGSRIFGART